MKADVLIKELDRVVDNFIKEINDSMKLDEHMKREDVCFELYLSDRFSISVKNRKSNIKATRNLHATNDDSKLIEESLIIKFIK